MTSSEASLGQTLVQCCWFSLDQQHAAKRSDGMSVEGVEPPGHSLSVLKRAVREPLIVS